MLQLETERLVLRQWKPADLPLFIEMNYYWCDKNRVSLKIIK